MYVYIYIYIHAYNDIQWLRMYTCNNNNNDKQLEYSGPRGPARRAPWGITTSIINIHIITIIIMVVQTYPKRFLPELNKTQ